MRQNSKQNNHFKEMKMDSILVRLLTAYRNYGYEIEEMNNKYVIRGGRHKDEKTIQQRLELTFNSNLKVGVLFLAIPYPTTQKELFTELLKAIDLEILNLKRLDSWDYENAINFLTFKDATESILLDVENATHYKDTK